MRIYRVEHKEKKKGPYTATYTYTVLPSAWGMGIGDKHPAPFCDGLDKSKPMLPGVDWFCGFRSMESLYDWFYNAAVVEKLIVEDFVIRVFDVPAGSYRAGLRQYTFKRNELDVKLEIPLDVMKCSDHTTNPYLD